MSPQKRHPADELLELRETLRRVREREELLRDFIAAIGETGGREIGRAALVTEVMLDDMRRLSPREATVHGFRRRRGAEPRPTGEPLTDEDDVRLQAAQTAG